MKRLPDTWRRSGTLLLAVTVACAIHATAFVFSPELDLKFDFTRTLNPEIQSYIMRSEGWASTPYGLAPTGDVLPKLLIGVSKSRFDDLIVEAETTKPGEKHVVLVASPVQEARVVGQSDEAETETLSNWLLWVARPLGERIQVSSRINDKSAVNLSQFLPDGSSCLINVTSNQKFVGVPLLRSVRIQRKLWTGSIVLLPFMYLAVIVSVRLLIAATRKTVGMRRLASLCVLGFIAAVCFIPTDVMAWSPQVVGVLALTGFGVSLANKTRPLTAGFVIVQLIFFAAFLRVDALGEARFQVLDADAAGFRRIANSMHWFYDSQSREPLFILGVKAMLSLFGDNDLSVRLTSFVFSVALVPAIWFTGREIRSPVAGTIAATLVALSPNWGFQSTRGLRLEAFTLALLLLTATIFSVRERSERTRTVWMGFAGAALCLVRITSLWFCLFGIAYGVYRTGGRLRSFLVPAALIVIALIPVWIYGAATFDDPLHTVNIHIRFYRNLEFVDQPGMPTSEEIAADPYAGAPVTPFEFFFKMHSATELASRTVKEYSNILTGGYLRQLTCDGSLALVAVAFLSYIVVAFSSHRILLIWIAMSIGPIAWLYSETSGPEWRLVFHVSALIYLCMGIGVDYAARHIHPVTDTHAET